MGARHGRRRRPQRAVGVSANAFGHSACAGEEIVIHLMRPNEPTIVAHYAARKRLPASIAEIGRAATSVRVRIAVTSASAASDSFAQRGRLKNRNASTRDWNCLVHIGATPSCRFICSEKYEEQEQRARYCNDQSTSASCQSIRGAMQRNHEKPLHIGNSHTTDSMAGRAARQIGKRGRLPRSISAPSPVQKHGETQDQQRPKAQASGGARDRKTVRCRTVATATT